MPSLAGTKLDKYDMLEEVGHGGMAVVYRGHDTVLKREVAVKVLHAHLSDREESRLRLQREAIAVAKLRHENILEIFDYSGTEADESYIVTEFIHGPTLREWIDDDLDPRPAVAAMIIHRLCLALCHAHQGGIVHRDIKPENVMIRKQDGCIKLMDFGIAQILDNQKLTLTGQLIGSPAYMAPELINGRPLDARTDLFSLGIILYQLATGALPFNGRNPHEVLNRIADGEYPPPSTICPLVDRDLEAIIAKALAPNPDDRYQSVETFAKELANYLEESGIEPSQAELIGYFKDPEKYVIELDERVCTALMEQAEHAASEGHSARAIRLLGRVLEIDAEHKAATSMLVRLRTRERRTRQALVVGGVLTAAGLVAAGIMLLPPEGEQPTQLALSDGHEQAAMVSPPPQPAVPGVKKVKPEPTAAGETGEPSDDDAAPETDDEPDTEPAKSRRSGSEPRASRKPVETACTLKLDGIPKARLGAVRVSVNGQPFVPSETGQVDVTFDDTMATARIEHDMYATKRVDLERPKCVAGAITVPMKAKPATVSFIGGPPKLTIACVKGCPDAVLGKPKYPDDFRRVKIPVTTTGTVIKVVYRATGYETDEDELTVYPGLNKKPVTLKQR